MLICTTFGADFCILSSIAGIVSKLHVVGDEFRIFCKLSAFDTIVANWQQPSSDIGKRGHVS